MKRPDVFFWLAPAVGLLVGAFALYAGFQHNPQGEFYDPVTGEINYAHSLLIALSWLIPVAVIGWSAYGALWGARWLTRRLFAKLGRPSPW